MGLCILGSSLIFSAQGGRGKEKNCKPAAKNFASPSEGAAEGGFKGGIPPRPSVPPERSGGGSVSLKMISRKV